MLTRLAKELILPSDVFDFKIATLTGELCCKEIFVLFLFSPALQDESMIAIGPPVGLW